ncbi:MAG: hypothetical protein ACJ8C3_25595 [Microvirga sp.]
MRVRAHRDPPNCANACGAYWQCAIVVADAKPEELVLGVKTVADKFLIEGPELVRARIAYGVERVFDELLWRKPQQQNLLAGLHDHERLDVLWELGKDAGIHRLLLKSVEILGPFRRISRPVDEQLSKSVVVDYLDSLDWHRNLLLLFSHDC